MEVIDNNRVLDNEGHTIVPQGKYDRISTYVDNFAVVRIGHNPNIVTNNCKFGLIDMKGEEVVPVIYDELYYFEAARCYIFRNYSQEIIERATKGSGILSKLKRYGYDEDADYMYYDVESGCIKPFSRHSTN